MSINKANFVDITPNPKILQTLGEIPFEPWQCFAELIDNSIDAFQYATEAGISLSKRQIIISWTAETAAAIDRRIEIRDTGPGMSLDIIQNAVKAGYSSKSPTNNLGLFGMGFNIATARLGEETLFLSTKSGDEEWIGVRIDFESMIKNENYDVPIEKLPKSNPAEHGTRIIIKKLKPGIFDRLRRGESQIRATLEDVYSPTLSSMESLQILIQSKHCNPKPYCLWDKSRFVVKNGVPVKAVIEIDEYVGTSLFAIEKNRYLSLEEEDVANEYLRENGSFPDGIVQREKRIRGWLGVQRFADTSMFGIDLVRNGRKILRKDKSLFSFYVDLTGTNKLEYPTELGTTWGGRIVGEIHVDHLVPTYQKNDFDRSDRSWYELITVLRSDGPILPKTRAEFGYSGENTSPLGQLIRAYNRMTPGTKNLAINQATAKEWSKKFFNGDPAFQTDEKWMEAAQQADQDRADRGASATPQANPGYIPSDDLDDYMPRAQSSTVQATSIPQQQLETGVSVTTVTDTNSSSEETDPIQDLLARSVVDRYLTREYRYHNCPSPIPVEVRKVTSGVIGSGSEGDPLLWDKQNHREFKFFYNMSHSFFATRKTTPQEIMLLQLAETFNRVHRLGRDISLVYIDLLEEMFPDEKIDQITIQERSNIFFERIRSAAVDLLSSRESEVLDLIHEHAGELEDTLLNLTSNPDLQNLLQTRAPGGIMSLVAVPERSLVRLVSKFPEEFFDSKFFRINYQSIQLASQESTERLREEAKDRILSYLKDALWVLSPWGGSSQRGNSRKSKEELLRCSNSLGLLEGVTVD